MGTRSGIPFDPSEVELVAIQVVTHGKTFTFPGATTHADVREWLAKWFDEHLAPTAWAAIYNTRDRRDDAERAERPFHRQYGDCKV
jgi:hypothetical protein